MVPTPDTAHGFQWEAEFARDYGMNLKPGSGNQWFARGDWGGRQVTLSLKSTRAKSFQLAESDIAEIEEITRGPGGDGHTPGMVIRLGNGRKLVVMELDDWVAMGQGEFTFHHSGAEAKAAARRERAKKPQLFADD